MVAWFAPFLTSVWWHIGKYEIKNIFSKSFKSLYFWLGIWVQGPYFDGKNTPHSLSMFITTSELCGFGIGFGIGRKYRPITVSVSVSGRNQNGGFGRSLCWCANFLAKSEAFNFWKVSPLHELLLHVFPCYSWSKIECLRYCLNFGYQNSLMLCLCVRVFGKIFEFVF